MAYWLADDADRIATDWIKRFDPRFWTVNFPRPAMAALTTPAADALRVDCLFYRRQDLVGLIWEAQDHHDHPLLAYETARDFRGLTLSFRWQASGDLKDLDALHGATLTIEGRDAAGNPRTWYVRLWNYATGTPDDCTVALDFDALDGGFLLPGEADRVWAGDIDRLFVSLVPPDYDGGDGVRAVPGEAVVTLSDIRCDGGGAVLAIGDAMVPPHDLRLASGYDDSYHIAPARLLRGALHLGYRGLIDHYVGMSHYFRLGWDALAGRFVVLSDGAALNGPCERWHADFLARATALDFQLILSLSFELFADHAPDAWMQRAGDGSPALTGWSPPSTLLSPCVAPAMAYLRAVALAFTALQATAGQPVFFQIGEPWWWSGLGDARAPCLYDAATTALYVAETGDPVPDVLHDVTDTPTADQWAYIDWLSGKLAAATGALRDAVLAAHSAARVALLVYTPQIIDTAAPMLARLNLPGGWAWPAFDVLQLEDYDHVTAGAWHAHTTALTTVIAALGYPPTATHYFAGFVLAAADRPQWRLIARAIDAARAGALAETFVWAWPQVARDGFTYFTLAAEDDVAGFHDVLFPLDVGFGASGGPEYATTVVTTASGYEQRNVNWAQARARYDAGLGVRGEADLAAVLAFFRARHGRAYAFRFRDPLDCTSGDADVSPLDQVLGTGDGATATFDLVKAYGDGAGVARRRITRPVAGTVRVALDGVEQLSGWALDAAQGQIVFETPPGPGVAVTAGFVFDVPVRFADDALSVSLATWRAGELPSIPLIEVREA